MALMSELLRGQEATVVQCDEYPSSKVFLQSRPAGVYTCARAVAGRSFPESLVEWGFHLQRLADGQKSVDAAADVDNMLTTTQQMVSSVLSQWTLEDSKEDGMLTVLWYRPKGGHYAVAVHICPMPQPKCLSSTVLVHGDARNNAKCKHTQWITDRVPIEQYAAKLSEQSGSPIHEVLLSQCAPDGDRLLLEGLVSNFYVVKDGKVFTAGEGVLEGSTRELVLKACKELSIPVVLEAPTLSERELWQAAFVTSAVRVVVDVTQILWEEDMALNRSLIPSGTTGFTQKIRAQILMPLK